MGTVFSIEEFSVYDGPGIRTSVFLKGCPLRCSWCHNPEGQSIEPEIVKSPNGCIGCGNCSKNLKSENGVLRLTEEHIKKCPQNLIRYCGEEYTAENLCEILLKNARIFKNGGGVTFSGGEPFMQWEFMFECIKILKDNNIHTAIQTSGFCDAEIFKQALDFADYFLFDIKLADDKMHKKYTGVSNKRILENLSLLASGNSDFVIRVPLIPTVTDTKENIRGIAELLKQNGIDYAELLPYNKMAGAKYKLVLREYKPDFDEKIQWEPREEIFKNYGVNIKIM